MRPHSHNWTLEALQFKGKALAPSPPNKNKQKNYGCHRSTAQSWERLGREKISTQSIQIHSGKNYCCKGRNLIEYSAKYLQKIKMNEISMTHTLARLQRLENDIEINPSNNPVSKRNEGDAAGLATGTLNNITSILKLLQTANPRSKPLIRFIYKNNDSKIISQEIISEIFFTHFQFMIFSIHKALHFLKYAKV